MERGPRTRTCWPNGSTPRKSIAVASRNGYVADEPIPPDGGDERSRFFTTWHEADGGVYLPLDGAEILTNWLAKTPEGVRREAQVKYGTNETTDTAFVMLRERPTDPASDD